MAEKNETKTTKGEKATDKAAATARKTAEKAKAAAQAAAPTSAKDAADKAKGAAYTVVGLGVMGFTKAQAGARSLVGTLHPKDLSETLKGGVQKVDAGLETAITKVEGAFEPMAEKLPEQARSLVKKAQDTGREARAKVRSKVVSS